MNNLNERIVINEAKDIPDNILKFLATVPSLLETNIVNQEDALNYLNSIINAKTKIPIGIRIKNENTFRSDILELARSIKGRIIEAQKS